MKLLLTTLFVSLFALSQTFAQTTDWVVQCGGPNSDKGISIGTDSLGFIYISGFYNGNATFGSITLSTSSNSNKDMFVAKMDSTGTFLWAISGGATFDDRALGMHVDPAGNVYLTGTFWGTLNIAGVTAPGNGHDTSVMAKIDKDGNGVWAKSFGASTGGGAPCSQFVWNKDDHSFDAKVDKEGNIYVTGFFSGDDAQFDGINLDNPKWGASCDPAGYVGKMDPNGNFLWAHKFDGIKDERGSRDNRMDIDKFGNVYVVGGFHNTGDYGSLNVTSIGEWDVFLFKMDTDGNFIWVKNIGSNKTDRGNGVAVDYCGNVYITGEYRNAMYLEGANASNGTDTLSHKKKRDVFVAKINTNGEWQWAKRARSSKTDKPYQMSVDENQQVFIAGLVGDSAKFNDNIILSTPGDTSTSAFVAQLDGSGQGEWVWAKMGGGPTENDRTGDITFDNYGNVYAVGFFEQSAIFDGTTLNALGAKDVFVWKLRKAVVDADLPNCVYIDIQPPGSGTVNVNGTNVSIFPTCQSLEDSSTHTFDAVPNGGFGFDNWDWDIHTPSPNNTAQSISVMTYVDDTLIVNFSQVVSDTITFIVQPPGAGTITVDAVNIAAFPNTSYFTDGSSSTLSATANGTFNFANWDFQNNVPLPNTTTNNITTTWNSNDTVYVNFTATPTYNITYQTNPVGSGDIDIDAVNTTVFPTTINYLQGTTVTLQANSVGTDVFENWTTQTSTLTPSNNVNFVQFDVLADDTITANYEYYDTLWTIAHPDGVAQFEVGSDVFTTTPFMGIYKVGETLNINTSPLGSATFLEWQLNTSPLPDYMENTFFTFINQDTLHAYYDNSVGIQNLGSDLESINVYPTIVKEEIFVDFTTKESINLNVDLIDVSGKIVAQLYNGQIEGNKTSKHSFSLNQASGVYFVRITSEKSQAQYKVIVP